MKIKMRVSITGTRDGQEWPAAGETIDLPADEATALVDAGIAEVASNGASVKVETAAIEAPETAAAPKSRARKTAASKKD
jgi:F0F1-type ATP synthase epsilon subunit